MSSVRSWRTFVSERLAAAAEEIVGVFEETLSVYEEEVSRQRRLLDVVLKPEIRLHRTELPQPPVCKDGEECHLEQQFCDPERKTSLHREDPEPPRMKEEQDGHSTTTSREGEQPELKQEDKLNTTLTCEEINHSHSQPSDPDHPLSIAEKEPPDNIYYTWIKSESGTGDPKVEPDSEKHGSPKLARRPEPKPRSEPYKCLYCSREYHFITELKAHMKIKHRCDRPFKCDTCGKTFKVRTALKFHIRTHTGEKPFKCTLCGNRFSRNFGLKMHLRIHTGERPHTCNDCGKRFSDRSCLRRHVRVHTREKPYKCSWCGKGLADKVTLKRHTASHTGEKPCKCDICGKGFPDLQCLKMHTKTHVWQKHIIAVEKNL
ncbi:zinc finger and SCAN domain-containing protein 12-like [Anabas testudineus]|uniref:zinc finger and SCAN domain-containing protein 12-like n=1 Tax=Anabas testudineus TaxID=64144 RepID=UPI000F39206B|nr:zinc finger and SCAN domain-containing protein 12-like [Anabas testudineus]